MLSKHETRILKTCFIHLYDNLLRRKKELIVSQTVFEFRNHTLITKAMARWQMYIRQAKHEELLLKAADQFRES